MTPNEPYLDIQVAEQVMGWSWDFDHARYDTPGGPCKLHEMPHYSADIAAAWPIFEQYEWILQRNSDWWVCHRSTRYSIYADWRAMEDDIALAVADTAPLAICRAALEAVKHAH